jgi:hypothetical protein
VNNFAKIRHFNKVELIFEGKPSFSSENVAKMKTLGFEPYKITKFANNYKIYRLSDVRDNSSTRLIKKYNNYAEFKNLKDRIEFVIVVDTDKIDKQHYLALQALYPLIHTDLLKNSDYKMMGGESDESDQNDKYYIQYYKYINGPCYVSIMSTNHIESAMIKHFHTRFLPCNYRIFSMYDDLYPLIGSKSQLWYGSVKNYELMKYEKLYNNYNYAVIFDDDKIVKLLNANAGDLIIATHVLNEGRPYLEFTIREVKARTIDDDVIEDE